MRHVGMIATALLLWSVGCDSNKGADLPAPAQTNQTIAAPAKADPKFAVNKFNRNQIPPDLETLPQPLGGLSFVDAQGEHIVVLSEDPATQAIRFQHLRIADGKVAQLLHKHDVIDDCEFDFSAGFEMGALGVTDADGDDIGEVTVMFKHACRSDVSPQDCELWMLEGDQRLTLRGNEILVLPGLEPIGDGKAAEEGFQDAPKLLEHAKKVWRDHVLTQVRSTEREPAQGAK